MNGTVVEFDAVTGLGVVDGGGERHPFHCVEIADGSRTIDVGEAVDFVLRRRLGRLEAAAIARR